MAIAALGSKEVLLQLVANYQGTNCRRLGAQKLWEKIAEYKQVGGEYELYPLSDYDKADPSGAFLEDLQYLIGAGLLKPLPAGTLEASPFAQFMTFTRELPADLTKLNDDLSA